jgi:quercetin dioxygenase-like cupin family protein
MSPPDPHAPPDRTPIQVGEIWENPVTRERAKILELPYKNPEGRATAELTALVGARVMGEHRHPALFERFTVLEGELTVKLAGQTTVLREGKTAVVEPGVWHDWWNASDRQDARVRVEVTPGERFAHMIETVFGLARLGHTNSKGMPDPLQLALFAQEFSDVIEFRSPPSAVQRTLFSALGSNCALARVSCHIPATLSHRSGAKDVAAVRSLSHRKSRSGTEATINWAAEMAAYGTHWAATSWRALAEPVQEPWTD